MSSGLRTPLPVMWALGELEKVFLPGASSLLFIPERHPVRETFAKALASIRDGTDLPEGAGMNGYASNSINPAQLLGRWWRCRGLRLWSTERRICA